MDTDKVIIDIRSRCKRWELDAIVQALYTVIDTIKSESGNITELDIREIIEGLEEL